MNKMKKAILAILGASLLGSLIGVAPVEARSVGEKAAQKRVEILGYLRMVRPMVMNFPCEPQPQCVETAVAAKETPARIKEYNEVKRVYQEGLVYLVERNYINSYLRFLDAQKRTEALMEKMSQVYIDRAESMMRDAIEQKDPNDPRDSTLVDISIEYGPNSKLRRDFQYDREAPNEGRRYDPRIVHYARNKYRIEANVEKGYHHLGMAKEARLKALLVDSHLAPHQKLEPRHRSQRIDRYMQTVILARLAKFNAEVIFNLKYPYDNYKIDELPKEFTDGFDAEKVPALDKVKMEWINNPYYLPKERHPVFNLSIPEAYRVDATDARSLVHSDEVDMRIKFKFLKKSPAKIISGGEKTGDKKEAKTN